MDLELLLLFFLFLNRKYNLDDKTMEIQPSKTRRIVDYPQLILSRRYDRMIPDGNAVIQGLTTRFKRSKGAHRLLEGPV